MKLSEELQALSTQFMDVYASNTSGRHFSPAELRSIIERLADATIKSEELEIELMRLKPPEPSAAQGSNVVEISNWKQNSKMKRSS